MTKEKAFEEAQRRWGSLGSVYDRQSAPEIDWKSARFWVGNPDSTDEWDFDTGPKHCFGNGNTWEEAFADADRRQPAEKGAQDGPVR